ncbi:lipopolysaccharide biosynthesis protein [Aliiroseovarius sp. YM-037]|uniref:lipopolysaccharide biosynthesis protein n=1 Tax=Aliiroseovarius sp. YM-037 TaxID=3341728 RepID=UPI003A7FB1AA
MRSGTAIVLGGTVGAQVIGFAALPILSRLYDPAAFGQFQTFMSALLVIMPLAALRYEYAILRVRSGVGLVTAIALCLGLNLLLPLLLLGLTYGVRYLAPNMLPDILGVGPWLAVGALAVGLLQTASQLPVRQKNYRMIALSRVSQTSVFQVSAMIAGANSHTPSALILILCDVLGRLLAAALLFVSWLRSAPGLAAPSLRGTRRIARTYRSYPFFSVPSSLVSALSAAVPFFAISLIFSAEALGQFAMAWRVVFMPIGLVAFALSQVLNAELSQTLRGANDGDARPIRQLVSKMALLAIVPSALIYLAAPSAFSIVLGADWVEAGQIAAAMAPLVFFMGVHSPINTVLVVIGHPHLQLAWEAARLCLLLMFWAATDASAAPDLIHTTTQFGVLMSGCSAAYLALVFYVTERGRLSTSRVAT